MSAMLYGIVLMKNNTLETTKETAMEEFSRRLRRVYVDRKGRHIDLRDYTAHEMLS